MSGLAGRLLEAAGRHPAARQLIERIGRTDAVTPALARIRGATGSSGALFLAHIAHVTNRAFAVVAPDIERAEAWRDDLAFLLGEDRVVYLPPLDVVSWSGQTATGPIRDDRIQALIRLGDPEPPIAVIPAGSLHRLIPSPATLRARAIPVEPGYGSDPAALLRRLVVAGYRSVPEIGESGEVSRRGGIVFVASKRGVGQFDGTGWSYPSALSVSSSHQRSAMATATTSRSCAACT